MNEEMNKYDELINLLYDFVKRVSKGETTSDTEVAILPEVANILAKLLSV